MVHSTLYIMDFNFVFLHRKLAQKAYTCGSLEPARTWLGCSSCLTKFGINLENIKTIIYTC